jgi:predicted DNA-binding protein
MTDDKQTRQMTIRLPVDVYERARELAEADRRKVATWVALVIERWVDQQGGD